MAEATENVPIFVDVETQEQYPMQPESYAVYTHSNHQSPVKQGIALEQNIQMPPVESDEVSGNLQFEFDLGEPEEMDNDKEKSIASQKAKVNCKDNSKSIRCTEVNNGSVCYYKTNTEDRLIRHIRKVHRGENPFQCTMCDYSTYNKALFEEHVRIHQGIKPFKCKFCPYRSVSKKNTKKHEQRHRPDNPLKCPECDFIARHERSLQAHKVSHTGIAQCSFCDFKANNVYVLNNHIKGRHGETNKAKVHSCEKCGAKFSDSVGLATHVRKARKCEICATRLCNKVLFNTHMLMVHKISLDGDKIFKCALCDWSSSHKSRILLHLIHHPNQIVDESIVDTTILKNFGIMQ